MKNDRPLSRKQIVRPGRGQRHAGDQRAEDARQVELEGIERDGVRQILAGHQGRQQRLVGRAAEGLGDAGAERQRQHRVDRHVRGAAEHERGEHEGAGRLHELRADEQPATVVPIGDHAADQRQQQDRQLADEGVQAEPERRSADRQDQPVLRDLLHPRPRRGQHVAAPEQPEVAGGERRGEAGEAAPRRRGGRSFGPKIQDAGMVPRFGGGVLADGGCRMLAQWLQDRFRSSSTATTATSTPPPSRTRPRRWTRHLDRGGMMLVTLAGAMSTAELGLSLAEMIRQGKVHAHLLHRREPRGRRLQPRRARLTTSACPTTAT